MQFDHTSSHDCQKSAYKGLYKSCFESWIRLHWNQENLVSPNLAWVDQTACTVACIMETLNPSDSVKQSQQTTLYVCFNNVLFRDYSGFKICDSKYLIWLKCVRDFLKLVRDLAHYFWEIYLSLGHFLWDFLPKIEQISQTLAPKCSLTFVIYLNVFFLLFLWFLCRFRDWGLFCLLFYYFSWQVRQ